MNKTRLAAAIAAVLGATSAHGVSVNAEGVGQALIFPYYTVRSVDGGQFNTYLSVLNASPRAKAVRVNVREARLGRAVATLNVFLSPNDIWTGAIVPAGEGARLVWDDTSCTDPALPLGPAPTFHRSIDFHSRNYSDANADGAGTGLDRTREGYVEMLEMAMLAGTSERAVTHTSGGVPANCAGILPPADLQLEPPSGGLSGTLTVIDVLRGMDFTVNAEALDALANRPFYRPASDDYPDFNAAEIDPVSVVLTGSRLYRSTWSRPVDAVTAALMRTADFEYTVEHNTRSHTDFVLTLPTRRLHANATSTTRPFTKPAQWSEGCGGTANIQQPAPLGEALSVFAFNRDERGRLINNSSCPFSGLCYGPFPGSCASVAVASVHNPGLAHADDVGATMVLGSTGGGFAGPPTGRIFVGNGSAFLAGWLSLQPSNAPEASMASGDDSQRTNLTNGEITRGPHTYRGLPMVGLGVRTFRNGTLDCAGVACQGNFGGAFPFRYQRSISP